MPDRKSRLSRKASKSSRKSKSSRSKSSRSSTGTSLGSKSSGLLTSGSATSTDFSTDDLSSKTDLSTETLRSQLKIFTEVRRKKILMIFELMIVGLLLIAGAILGIGINMWSESRQLFPMEGAIPDIVPRSRSNPFPYIPLQIQNKQTEECIDDLGAGERDKWITRITLGYVGYFTMRPCQRTFHFAQYFLYTKSGQFKKNDLCWKYNRWDNLSSITMQLLKCSGDHGNEYAVITENSTIYVPYYDKCQTPFTATTVNTERVGLYLEECKPVKYQKWIFKKVDMKNILFGGVGHSFKSRKAMNLEYLTKVVTDKPKHKIKAHN